MSIEPWIGSGASALVPIEIATSRQVGTRDDV